MSFVSIVARETFISIMCDGRMTSVDGKALEENVKKFRRLNDKCYIAFAGTYDLCIECAKDVERLFDENNSLEDVIDKIKDKINQTHYDEVTHKVMFSLGGLSSEGEVIITKMSNNPEIDFEIFKPRGNDITYIFLHNTDEELVNLDKEFERICKNIKVTTQSKLKKAQKILNDKIADIDNKVNKIEQNLIIKR